MPRSSNERPRTTPRALLLAAVVAFGCATTGSPPPGPDSADDGARSFVRACAACHGNAGRGDGPAAQALRTPPPDLTRLAGRHGGTFPRAHVRSVMLGEVDVRAHGTREMPVWALEFGPSASGPTAVASFVAVRRMEAILDHLATIQRDAGP